MIMIDLFLKELEAEAQTTRKMLAIVPNDKYDWQPHPKSMTIKSLTTHIAELPGWISIALTTDELDFANNPYKPEIITNTSELLTYFEKTFEEGKKHLTSTSENKLSEKWVMRSGEKIYSSRLKGEVIRVSISQTIHHRAQLGVYLRLLNIPLPGSYGPTADDVQFS